MVADLSDQAVLYQDPAIGDQCPTLNDTCIADQLTPAHLGPLTSSNSGVLRAADRRHIPPTITLSSPKWAVRTVGPLHRLRHHRQTLRATLTEELTAHQAPTKDDDIRVDHQLHRLDGALE